MSMRYPGGLIASTPVTANYPSGVWTQAQAAPYQAQNVWTRDQFWPYTTLLLQGDGAVNGAQNNTFLDSSSNNFTITRNGNTTQGAFTPYEATGYWSNYQSNVSADYINFTTSPGSAFEFTGNYTIECWIFPIALASDTSLWVTSPNDASYHALNIDATNYNLYLNGGSPAASIAHGLIINAWNHVAMVRSGSTITVYTNGVSRGTTTNSSTNGYTNPIIARNGGGVSGNTRYMSNLRIVKSAVYTTNFTPPAVPLTAITNTSLLTCQSNRFIDNSANALVATVTGSPSVQSFQPFPGATTWSASVLGGSGYFDGNGDYLTAAQNAAFNFGTGAFTVEAFLYLTAYPSASTSIFSLGNGAVGGAIFSGWAFLFDGTTIRFYRFDGTETVYTVSASIPLNAWSHLVAVRNGSSNLAIFLNGTRILSTTTSLSYNNVNSDPLNCGAWTSGGGATTHYLTGYINGGRIVKGTAVYDPTLTTLTVPTAPLTAITNTSLLLNMTNAGIYDNSMMNNLETVGNAQVSTSVVKYGTGSMAFDGSGDYLLVPSRATTSLEGDFTIELWAYRNATNNFRAWCIGDSFTASGIELYVSGSNPGNWTVWGNNASQIVAATATRGVWTHLALVRSGSIMRMYVDGVQRGASWTYSSTFSGNVYVAAELYNGTLTTDTNGYIDDFRITKAARYITNFTPPPARMPGQ